MNNNLSENLKKIRKDNNLSQEQLAEELGVSRQAISKWESGIAYPEMDKIIQLCNKFELNIDDLLNKDIREIKGEETSKRNINKAIDSFLNFITDSIGLFSNMNLKSKIKCLFEQCVIILILLIICLILGSILNSILGGILRHLPHGIYFFIWDILKAIYVLSSIIVSSGIVIHIFKTRYLDYYSKIKNELLNEEKEETKINNELIDENKNNDKQNKILHKRNEEKIVIRDPKHSEYKFVHSIFKVFVLGIKFFALIILGLLCIVLIGLLACFASSFVIHKTGIFFIGLLLAFTSAGIIDIIIIILLLNFIFNRKNDKKKMIWSFILSLISLGIGVGLVFIGSLKFDYIAFDENSEELVSNKINVEMKDNLFVLHHDEIEYIEKDIDNIEFEIKTNKLVDVKNHIGQDGRIYFYTYTPSLKIIFDEVIKNLNDYKVVDLNSEIYDIKVYASAENILKLKSNLNNEQEKNKQFNELQNKIAEYEKTISELQTKECNCN